MKLVIEKAQLLLAKVKDNLKLEKKDGKEEWVKAPGQKIELTLLVDATNDLSKGEVKVFTSAKTLDCNCEDFVKNLKRFIDLDLTCQLVELKDRNSYVFYDVKYEGQDILSPFCSKETNEDLPF